MHLLRPSVDINLVGVIPAIGDASLIGAARDDFAVVARIRVAPLPRRARLAALQSVIFRFLRITAIALVQALANLAADDATDDGTRDSGGDLAAPLPT